MYTFTPRDKRSSNGPEPSPADKYPEDSPVRRRPQANMPAQGINPEDTEAFPALGEAARLPRRARRSTFGSAPSGANPITPGGESHQQSSATVPRPTAHQMQQQQQQAPRPPVTQQEFIERMRARSIRQSDFNISSALGRQQAQGGQGTNPTYAFNRLEASRQAQREATVAQLRAAFLEPQRSSSALAASGPAAGTAAQGELPSAVHGLPPHPHMPPSEMSSFSGHDDAHRDSPARMASYMPRHTPTPGASFDRPGRPQPAMAFSEFVPRSQDETRTAHPAAQRVPLTSQPFRAPTASASRTNQIHPLDRPIQFTPRPAPARRARPAILSGLGAYQALPQDINPDLAAYLATTGISDRPEAESSFSGYDNRAASGYNNRATSAYENRATSSYDNRATSSYDNRATSAYNNPASSTYDNPSTYAPFYTADPAPQDSPAQDEPTTPRAETLAPFTPADYETTPPLSRPSSPDLDIQGHDALTPDARPLSEDQVSGKKYGIEIGGIGSSLLNTSDRLKWMGATAEALVHTSGKDKVAGGQASGGTTSGGQASSGMTSSGTTSGATPSGYTTFGGTTSSYSTYGGTSLAAMTSSGIPSTGMAAEQVKHLWQPEQRPQAKWNPPDQGRMVQSRLGGFMMKPREGDGWGGWKRVPKLEQKERERKEKEEREKKEKEEREKKGE